MKKDFIIIAVNLVNKHLSAKLIVKILSNLLFDNF